MKKRVVGFLSVLLVFCLIFSFSAYAHSGRTDSSGGHRDNKNKSGLGDYHYHCGGHPAHLHENGICPYDPKDKISINDAPSKMYVGDMNQLTWSVKAYSGSDWVDWESSDESVVTVSDSGELKAVAPGKARITAILLNGEKSFNITVSNREIEKISILPTSDEFVVGDVFSVSAEISPANATDKRIEWSSDNENVAVIMEDGTVIIVGEGTAKITASALDGSKKKASLEVAAKANDGSTIDSTAIMVQLPAGYVFMVKPGSPAAKFARSYALPYEYVSPDGLPLQIGSRGETVRDIQTALISNAYLEGKADGIFGKNTDAAVKNFCEANNMEYDGTINFERYVAIMESAKTES